MFSKNQVRVLMLLILVIGSWRLVEYVIRRQTWEEVPAIVDGVRIDEIERGDGAGNSVYKVSIRYRFSIAGEEYRSEQLDFFGGESFVMEDPSDAEAKAAKYRSNPPTVCRVHPTDRSRSAIVPEAELDGAIVIFVVVILFTIGVFWKSIARWIHGGEEPGGPTFLLDVMPPITWALVISIPVVALLVIKFVEESGAADWVETPAIVISSELSYDDEWEPRILFEWADGKGERHRSRRVTFDSFYGSVTAIERLLEDYKEGSVVSCYVDPDDITQAVLVRKYWLGTTGLIGFVLLIFCMWWWVARRWGTWRSGDEPPEINVSKLFRLNSPLVVGAVVFLIEASVPIFREWQLGVNFSNTQILATFALLVLVTYALFALSRRTGQHRSA